VNARIVALGSEEHRAIELLLPWYATGSLEPGETAEVEAHLHTCAACRTELAWQRRLCSVAPADAAQRVDAGWSALQRRLGAEQGEAAEAARRDMAPIATTPAAPTQLAATFVAAAADSMPTAAAPIASPVPARATHRRHRAATRRDPMRWLPWAFAAQFACMAAFAVFLLAPPSNPAPYRTLGAPTAAVSAANLLVVFRPGATEAQMRAALRADEATLVGGPTITDAYLVDVRPGRLAGALARLRANPAVARVESLEAGPPQ
jgi:hypothetical protein